MRGRSSARNTPGAAGKSAPGLISPPWRQAPVQPLGVDSKGGGRGPRPLCRFKGVSLNSIDVIFHKNQKVRQAWKSYMDEADKPSGNVKKCAVGKHPKSEKHGNTAQFSEVERSGTQENCGGIGSGCRLRLRPLPVLRRRQSQRVARIDPNAVVVDKNIAENDRFDLFSR